MDYKSLHDLFDRFLSPAESAGDYTYRGPFRDGEQMELGILAYKDFSLLRLADKAIACYAWEEDALITTETYEDGYKNKDSIFSEEDQYFRPSRLIVELIPILLLKYRMKPGKNEPITLHAFLPTERLWCVNRKWYSFDRYKEDLGKIACLYLNRIHHLKDTMVIKIPTAATSDSLKLVQRFGLETELADKVQAFIDTECAPPDPYESAGWEIGGEDE